MMVSFFEKKLYFPEFAGNETVSFAGAIELPYLTRSAIVVPGEAAESQAFNYPLKFKEVKIAS